MIPVLRHPSESGDPFFRSTIRRMVAAVAAATRNVCAALKWVPAFAGMTAFGLVLTGCNAQHEASGKAVSKSDLAINAASDQARASLPAFWTLYEGKDPSRTQFAVNAMIATADGKHEAIWVGVTGHKDGQIEGVLANEPEDLPGQHLGSPVMVSDNDVRDWSYKKDGKTYGSYTTRALIPQLNQEERAEVAAKLSAQPTEQAAN